MNGGHIHTGALSHLPSDLVKGHHKVGVLRVKQGQCSEEDIFCNEHEPGPFDQFLRVLGKESHTYPWLHMAASWSIEVFLSDWCLPSCLQVIVSSCRGLRGFWVGWTVNETSQGSPACLPSSRVWTSCSMSPLSSPSLPTTHNRCDKMGLNCELAVCLICVPPPPLPTHTHTSKQETSYWQ